MLRRKYSTQKHTDPSQVAGMNTKKKDSKTLFFGPWCQKKSLGKVQILPHSVTPLKRNSVTNMYPKVELMVTILNASTIFRVPLGGMLIAPGIKLKNQILIGGIFST